MRPEHSRRGTVLPLHSHDDLQHGQRRSHRVLAAAIAGNVLEFYDFVTYAFFAVYIAKAFFPAATPTASLLQAIAVFGAGFVTRPVGGLLLGAYADRAGRKPAMLLSAVLITVGTIGLALTPPYERIGLLAPLLVVGFRLVQGAALGGEVGPATAYLVESAPTSRRGLYASWLLAGQGLAALLAGAAGLLVTRALSPEQLQAWGWRVPFAAGALLVPVALYLRRSMPESLQPAAAVRQPLLQALHAQRRTILLAILMILGSTVPVYVSYYMTTYAITTLHLPAFAAMAATVALGVATFLAGLLGGALSDRFGRRPVNLWPRIVLALAIVPVFTMLLAQPSPGMLLAATGVLATLSALSAGAGFSAVAEGMPLPVRATALSITYAVGVALFGGSTQFVVAWLTNVTGYPSAPAWLVAASSAISAAAVLRFPETHPGRSGTRG